MSKININNLNFTKSEYIIPFWSEMYKKATLIN